MMHKDRFFAGACLSKLHGACLVVFVAAWVSCWGESAFAAGSPGDGKAILAAAGVKSGFCILIGPGDGKFAMDLAKGRNLAIQGLSPDKTEVENARRFIQSQKLYGQVTIVQRNLARLPYTGNLVNLVVVNEWPKQQKAGLTMKEVMRVVCPNGVAFFNGATANGVKTALGQAGIKNATVTQGAGGILVKKLRPPEMDEWNQRGYNAARSHVSKDTALGHVTGIRWLAGPYWPFGRNYQNGNAGIVSANGRNFYLTYNVAENMTKSPFEWEKEYYIVARDAYNGITLWSRPINHPFKPKQSKPKGSKEVFIFWAPGTMELAENLAAVGDRVYAVVENNVVALDAATGKTLVTFAKGYFPRRFLLEDNMLILVGAKSLQAFDSESGEKLWQIDGKFGTAVAGDGEVFCTNDRHNEIVCLDIKTGQEKWKAPTKRRYATDNRWPFYYKAGYLVFPLGKRSFDVHVVSAKDGKFLWNKKFGGRNAHFADGLIWLGLQGLDPATGEVKRDFSGRKKGVGGGCCPYVGTERVIVGSRPMKTIDVKTGELVSFHARHPCKTGLMPANGMVYTMPQACRCSMSYLRGYLAIATDDPEREKKLEIEDADRLQKGPAYGQPTTIKHKPLTIGSDWPMFRRDPQRTCFTRQTVGTNLRTLWEVQVDDQKRPTKTLDFEWLAQRLGGDRLTAPTIAAGKVYVSVPECHRVAALDQKSGSLIWTFTANGRIDVPPTIYNGLCLFGDTSGSVYCVTAADGKLVWRFNAAAKDKTIVAYGQPESVSPVVGGVLVEKGTAFFITGRAGLVDGGVSFYAVNPADGKLIKAVHNARMEGGDPDLLVSDGSIVRITTTSKYLKYRLKGASNGAKGHLYATRPLMNRFWRVHGIRSRQMDRKHMDKFFFWGHVGQVIVGDPDEKRTFAYKFLIKGYGVKFHQNVKEMAGDIMYWEGQGNLRTGKNQNSEDVPPKWKVHIPAPAQVEAMVVAGDILFAAGPVDKYHRDKGGFLRAYNVTDGKQLKEWTLKAPPAADGIAVANSRLYIAAQDGKLLCLGSK